MNKSVRRTAAAPSIPVYNCQTGRIAPPGIPNPGGVWNCIYGDVHIRIAKENRDNSMNIEGYWAVEGNRLTGRLHGNTMELQYFQQNGAEGNWTIILDETLSQGKGRGSTLEAVPRKLKEKAFGTCLVRIKTSSHKRLSDGASTCRLAVAMKRRSSGSSWLLTLQRSIKRQIDTTLSGRAACERLTAQLLSKTG